VRWVFTTSDTTDASVLDRARHLVRQQRLSARDRMALVLPIAGIGGCMLLTSSLMSGCTLLLAEVSDPPARQFLARERVTLAGLTDARGGATATREIGDLIGGPTVGQDIRRPAATCGRAP
jgi:acyl-CoA synthetase (AMP-forming)/AMP-acid ligase II